MPRTNDDVEAALLEYADLLAIAADDAFKARAYEKAAAAVGAHPGDVGELDVKGLMAIPGVGRSIAEKIAGLVETGSFPALEELRVRLRGGREAAETLRHDQVGIAGHRTELGQILGALDERREHLRRRLDRLPVGVFA